jgi:hypothetical protein
VRLKNRLPINVYWLDQEAEWQAAEDGAVGDFFD